MSIVNGCGRGDPNLTYVSGVVTLDGQPLVAATVTYTPTERDTGSFAFGVTDQNGKYQLLTGSKKGAWRTAYKVSISKTKGGNADEPEDENGEEPEDEPDPDDSPEVSPEDEETLPSRYNVETELTAEVTDSVKTFDFGLTSG